MYFLSFETSTKIFSLALSCDEKVLRYRNIKTALVLENSMLPAMDKLLDSAGIKFNQIDGFAIALGPGSFTSLRVGLSTVKAFCLATGKHVIGIPTLDIIAQGVAGRYACDQICVISDARRQKVYACLYGADGRRQSDYLLTSLSDILDKVKDATLFVGDAVGLYRKEIQGAYRKCSLDACQCLFADEKWWHPQAKVMAGLAYRRFSGKHYDQAEKLVPIYLYAQDCQVSVHEAKT
ncbi:MAG: tRNA (adenosine(37)-N6)-threonylcarbamoyltransferase complex dimerization subunit type 1 TsaB [Candidatus Omnitrophica bacterium]|nr:tRNA (adenosine(37)-N6)-threonylcarbamoyltransferase complex dimerization subunit type 1 TsaB [Candidatus Omnitrophota bacterium]MDE2222330.1 tRNA (adenosine(37)-N6)-threonylcarbamoyltransferase complex dimerization subunit type 1 TsaB [Candidatus Omnitrophota bacterium]